MKFVFIFIFFLSINLYSQYDLKYIGNISVIRNNQKINLDNAIKLYDKDIITTENDGYAEIKINGKYYYIANNGKVNLDSKNAELKKGAIYIRNNAFKSLEEFKKYDNDLQIYADPDSKIF